MKNCAFSIALLFSSFLVNANQLSNQHINFTEVADGVFMFQGETKEFFSTEKGMVSNIIFIIGKEAVAVIDTGGSFNQGQLIRQAIRQQTSLPIKYVINTHVHIDHIFGNKAFVQDKPEFIAHKNYPRALAIKGPYYKERLQKAWYRGSEIVEVTQLINQTETINLGERLLTIMPVRKAHSDNDLIIFDSTTSTLIVGDLVFEDHCPVIDGSLSGWLEVLKNMKEQPFSLLIAGHGAAQGDNSGIIKTESYLLKLREAVRSAIKNNTDLNTASNTLLTNEADNWRLFGEFHKRNVISAYTELEWE